MNVIICHLQSMNLVALLIANVVEDQLAILFYSLIVECIVSIPWHQYKMVGYLAIFMLKTFNSNAYHIQAMGGWHYLWLWCQKKAHFTNLGIRVLLIPWFLIFCKTLICFLTSPGFNQGYTCLCEYFRSFFWGSWNFTQDFLTFFVLDKALSLIFP